MRLGRSRRVHGLADTTIYITGATAYRSPAVAAIKTFLDSGTPTIIYGAKKRRDQ